MRKEIKFYKSSDEYGYLSNLYPVKLNFEGRSFRSSEEAYQYGKPNYKELKEWVVSAPDQVYVAWAGHNIRKRDRVMNWDLIKVERMKKVNLAKYRQNSSLLKKLLETENTVLIEDSPIDWFWGIGKDGKGHNYLGKILMQVRKELRKEQKS